MNKKLKGLVLLGVLLGSGATLSGCAAHYADHDPLEPMNRVFYKFNDTLDKHVLEPVAVKYKEYTPSPVRTGVTNFFNNLGYLNTVANDFLQGKIEQGFGDTGRFVVNSSVGVLGLFDVATKWGLPKHEEDLGQTFGVWGMPEIAYLVIPLNGPSSVRDAPNLVTSSYLNPLFYASTIVAFPLGALQVINMRANLLQATKVRDEAAIDPYVFTRAAYEQRRRYEIYDGNPPSQGLDEFMEEGIGNGGGSSGKSNGAKAKTSKSDASGAALKIN